jgi:hypothetical protein
MYNTLYNCAATPNEVPDNIRANEYGKEAKGRLSTRGVVGDEKERVRFLGWPYGSVARAGPASERQTFADIAVLCESSGHFSRVGRGKIDFSWSHC